MNSSVVPELRVRPHDSASALDERCDLVGDESLREGDVVREHDELLAKLLAQRHLVVRRAELLQPGPQFNGNLSPSLNTYILAPNVTSFWQPFGDVGFKYQASIPVIYSYYSR